VNILLILPYRKATAPVNKIRQTEFGTDNQKKSSDSRVRRDVTEYEYSSCRIKQYIPGVSVASGLLKQA
jgi:hypothetical protein